MNPAIDVRDLHFEVHGDGEPILLVHGFPLSGRLWDAVARGLGEGYRIIVPDLRGHGRSRATPAATMRDYAEDLAAILDRIGEARPVVLAGMSMGGYVAFEFCRLHPDRVRALVLTNTRAQADGAEAAQGRRDTAARVLREGSAVVAESMTAKLFAPSAPEALRAEWQAAMAATPPEGIVAALLAMAERPDSFATLAALRCPVLVVAGAEDAITPPADSERMRDAARQAVLAVIPGAGHMTAVEQPARFVAVLRSFLDGAVRARG